MNWWIEEYKKYHAEKNTNYPGNNLKPQLHHIKDKRGLSKKSSNYEVIGLCYEHHLGKTGYHTSPKKFTEKWGTQKELLELNLKLVQCCGGEICQ